MSIGVASFPDSASDSDGVLAAADAALLRAKARGRDRVCLAGEDTTRMAAMIAGDLVDLGRRFAAALDLSEAETAGLVTALAVYEVGASLGDDVQAILGAGNGQRRRAHGRRRQARRAPPGRRGAALRERALGRHAAIPRAGAAARSRAWRAPSPSVGSTGAAATRRWSGCGATSARASIRAWSSASSPCCAAQPISATRRPPDGAKASPPPADDDARRHARPAAAPCASEP